MNNIYNTPLVASCLKNESEIDEIQKRWKDSKHPINNPKGYGYPDKLANENILAPKFQTKRLSHLEQLTQIIYEDLSCRPEYYQSGKKSNQDAFKKYVTKSVRIPFPYPQDRKDEDIGKEERVQWVNQTKFYPTINNKSTDDDYEKFCELRFNKLLLLARVCNFIDKIQVQDYKENKIVIDHLGALRGNTDSLLYGEKHSLSAYLGQWIIRLFPFKDYHGFYSEKYGEEEGSGKKVVYEHFTPMSFFRDLIWFKGKRDDKYIFDWDNDEHKAYNVEEWLSFLWYRYRTVLILECEDKELTDKGEKSRRSAGNEAYTATKVTGKTEVFSPIKIHSSMDKAWDEVHKIERLKKLIP
jgi:hypothetical protein